MKHKKHKKENHKAGKKWQSVFTLYDLMCERWIGGRIDKTLPDVDVLFEWYEAQVDRVDEIEKGAANLVYEWAKDGCPTIYVSTEVAVWLSGCGAKDITYEAFPPVFAAPFVMVFEKGSICDGVPLHPCMCCFDERLLFKYFSDLYQEIRTPDALQLICWPETETPEGFGRRNLAYACGSLQDLGDAEGWFSRRAWPGTVAGANACFGGSLAAKVALYCAAYPNALEIGPPRPGNLAGHQEFYIHATDVIKEDTRSLPAGGTHNSPRAHFRRGHFRRLHDECYTRNPDGSVRVVFVRESIVAMKDKRVYTVKDAPRNRRLSVLPTTGTDPATEG